MQMNNYKQSILKIKGEIRAENEDVAENVYAENRLDYLRFKSSLDRTEVFKNTVYKDQLEMFISVKQNQAIAEYDIQNKTHYEKTICRPFKEIEDKPAIYCTFHLGSYKLIPAILFMNTKLVLVVNGKTIIANNEFYKKNIAALGIKDFYIINAEEQYAIIRLIKLVKDGYSLLFYIDGNTGIGGFERKDDKLEIIDFLGNKILSRKGIAYLACKLDLPIISIYSVTKNSENNFYFEKPIVKDDFKGYSTHEFTQKCTQLIWHRFENILLQSPEKWEGWLYLYHFFTKHNYPQVRNDTVTSIKKSKIYFSSKISLFRKNEKYYLYNNFDYKIMEVSKVLFVLLNKMNTKKLLIDVEDLSTIISPSTLIELINNNVLIQKL